MRRCAWVCCRAAEGWWRGLLLAACWLGVGMALPARAELFELRAAHVVATVGGTQTRADVRLPYHWDQLHRDRPGRAEFEIHFVLPAVPDRLSALYFPRVGNRAEIWLNGTLLARYGRLDGGSGDDYAKAPQYLLLPERLLRQDNDLRIVLEADGGRRGGLSVPLIGPAEELQAVYQHDYRWRVTGSLVVVVFSLVVGTIALLLWLTQRAPDAGGRDGLYLSAALAELFWVVRISDLAIEHPPVGWLWWRVLQVLVFAAWIFGVAMFCHHVAGWQRHPSMRWMTRLLGGMLLTSVPVSLAAQYWHTDIFLTVWYGVATAFFVGYGGIYLWATLRQPTTQRVLVTIAGLFNVAVGVRDWAVIRAGGNFEEISWIRYSSMLFGLSLLYIVGARFKRSSEQARDLMANMAARIRAREHELSDSYHQLEQLAREQERTAERARILRDMHDGVGAHISSAIRQLQTGKASGDQLLQTLRDSLDQLKLSIDAMNLPPGDVTAMLANLRYRLEPRLKNADIELQWDVDRLPPLARLDAKAMRELQFMVFEALSNVLQHANASRLRIELHAALEGGVRLRVIDNGHGFDPARMRPQGLASLHERAALLGAQLNVASVPGHTVVEIDLPAQARPLN